MTLAQQACSAPPSKSLGVASTGRAVDAACRACFDSPLLRLLETSHVRTRPRGTGPSPPAPRSVLQRAGPALLAAGVRRAAALARFSTSDLRAIGIEADVAAVLCRAARQVAGARASS